MRIGVVMNEDSSAFERRVNVESNGLSAESQPLLNEASTGTWLWTSSTRKCGIF